MLFRLVVCIVMIIFPIWLVFGCMIPLGKDIALYVGQIIHPLPKYVQPRAFPYIMVAVSLIAEGVAIWLCYVSLMFWKEVGPEVLGWLKEL